jgi:ATP-dependent DNA helicase RecG
MKVIYQKKLNITRSTIQKHIEKLKSREVIERIGPDKGGYWKIEDENIPQ